jgi:hypothetical protein
MHNKHLVRRVDERSPEPRPDVKSIRKLWAFLLGINIILLLLLGYSSDVSNLHLIEILFLALDMIAIFGLYGYVVKKQIRSSALRVIYRFLSLLCGLRAILVIYLVARERVESPWTGQLEQYVSLVNLASTSLLALNAIWRYVATREPA